MARKNVSFDAQTEMNDDLPLKKKNLSAKKLEQKRARGNVRIQMVIRTIEEKQLSKGMSIRNVFNQEQGIIVQQDEDKNEVNAFDTYDHAKKVQVGKGEMSYPSGPPSFAGHSVSSHHPVRGMMRKFTRKTITKVITVLEEEVRNEEVRKKVDMLFETWYSCNDPATRRTKAIFKKSMGKKYIPFVVREEKLCFLHQPHQNSVVHACKDCASSRAKAMMQKCLVQKS
jgi:hypothetical protein